MKKSDTRVPLPPYIPFKTFQGFIEKLKGTAVPERVDSSLLKTYSGSVGRQLVAALKFLKLLDESGYTTGPLKSIVQSVGGPEWGANLGDVISVAYGDVIGDLNLDVATSGQLADRFKSRGAEGVVLQRCISFYVSATKSAGWTISPHIGNRERSRPERTSRQQLKRSLSKENLPAQFDEPPAGGSVRFAFPIPGKSTGSIILPADLSNEDWLMIDTMIRAYITRKQGK